ncbi:MAG: siphovirus Gp157 family protein [Alkalibacterium sp.]|nr:siphovirus Gp157 family protein [Alkalibacterium sp.]
MATLYELTDTMKELLDMAQSGEVDQETIDATIESMDLQTDVESKIDGYAYVMDELKASNDRIQDEIKRLQARKRVQMNNYTRMRETLLDTFKLLELGKVKTDKYTVSIRRNPVKMIVRDDSSIPKRFYKEQAPKLNKSELKEYLTSSDEDLEGVELTQDESLQIR